jgi:hypothetical protein
MFEIGDDIRTVYYDAVRALLLADADVHFPVSILLSGCRLPPHSRWQSTSLGTAVAGLFLRKETKSHV